MAIAIARIFKNKKPKDTISLLFYHNFFLCYLRIPESLPCLHDQVLAAAADAALSLSANQKKKQVRKITLIVALFAKKFCQHGSETNMLLQVIGPGILGGIVKGLKGGKADHNLDLSGTPKSTLNQLEGIFMKSPPSDSPHPVDHQEIVELDIGSASEKLYI